MNLLEELTLDDLDEEQRDLAECIGIEAYKKLVSSYAGNPINVRMPERITMKLRNDKIRLEFNGYNYADLSNTGYAKTKSEILLRILLLINVISRWRIKFHLMTWTEIRH